MDRDSGQNKRCTKLEVVEFCRQFELNLSKQFRVLMSIFWFSSAVGKNAHTDCAVIFSCPFENTNKPREENPCLRWRLRKQEGELQKEKANVKLAGHWLGGLGSIRRNIPKWRAPWKCGMSWKYRLFSKSWSAHLTLNPDVRRKSV
jgi:hypothetical protein